MDEKEEACIERKTYLFSVWPHRLHFSGVIITLIIRFQSKDYTVDSTRLFFVRGVRMEAEMLPLSGMLFMHYWFANSRRKDASCWRCCLTFHVFSCFLAQSFLSFYRAPPVFPCSRISPPPVHRLSPVTSRHRPPPNLQHQHQLKSDTCLKHFKSHVDFQDVILYWLFIIYTFVVLKTQITQICSRNVSVKLAMKTSFQNFN